MFCVFSEVFGLLQRFAGVFPWKFIAHSLFGETSSTSATSRCMTKRKMGYGTHRTNNRKEKKRKEKIGWLVEIRGGGTGDPRA